MTVRMSRMPSGPLSTTSSMLDRMTCMGWSLVSRYIKSRNLITFLISFWLIRLHVL